MSTCSTITFMIVRARLKRADRGVEAARGEVVLDLVEFVQEQLEPEFVSLVDDDEEHLVVFGRVGPRALESEQFVEVQVIAVGQVHIRPPRGCDGSRGSRTCSLRGG